MKILHVNHTDILGGAAIAVKRIHIGLLESGVDSHLLVDRMYGDLPNTHKTQLGFGQKYSSICNVLSRRIKGISSQSDQVGFSINCFANSLLRRIREINPDIVHLHWVGNNMLRIEDISRIAVPVVWTMHDMWPFCGTEHYNLSENEEWKHGYISNDNMGLRLSVDLRRWALRRKFASWADYPINFTGPSQWIVNSLLDSYLFQNLHRSSATVIPNGLDTRVFKPINRQKMREKYGIPIKSKVVVFGASDPNAFIKGSKHLRAALTHLKNTERDLQFVVFGADSFVLAGFENQLKNLGRIDTDDALCEIYNLADVVVVPSIMESFGQVASEANACGIPVCCFDVTGLRDIVDHKQTGYRAKPFDPLDLAAGIQFCLANEKLWNQLSENSRKKALDLFSINKISDLFTELYGKLLL